MKNTPVDSVNSPPPGLPDVQTILAVVNSAVRRHSRRYQCSSHEQADLFQDGCLAALTASCSYRPDAGASYRTWINKRVQGELVDSLRHQRSHGITQLPAKTRASALVVSTHSDDGDHSLSILDEAEFLAPGPEALAEEAEAIDLLNAGLPPGTRRLLADHYGFNGTPMSTREIAQREGVSHTAIEGRLDRALRQARRILQ